MESHLLYKRLADHYRKAIESGVLSAGERMPSVRRLMQVHRVSLSTALQACHVLEDDGLVEARARSGYFVRRPRRSPLQPATEPDTHRLPGPASYVGIHDRVSDFLAKSARYPISIDLATAVAPPDAYPVDALRQAVSRAARQHGDVLARSAPSLGDPALRAVLARRSLESGISVTPEDVIVTHGCSEAMNVALRSVAKAGDTIAVESPTYYGLLQIIESLGMRALEIPTSPQRGISIEALDLAFQTQPGIKAVVVIPNLQNPLGSVMPEADKAGLVRLCERAGVALIEDDTYGALVDGGKLLHAAKAWDETGNVIYCASLHKTLAPGMRLGWLLPGRWHARAAMLKFVSSRPNEALAQIAVAEVLGSKRYDRHIARLRQHLKTQRERMAQAIAEYFPAGTRLTMPGGGLLLWVELPEGTSSQAVFDAALRQGIRLAPGHMFSNSDRYANFLRISNGLSYSAQVDAALRRVGEIAADLPGVPRRPVTRMS